MKGPSIVLDQLALQLNQIEILQPISTQLEAGKLHALVGPNGAGKSSLLKCLLGLLPHQGTIERHWPSEPVTPAYLPQKAHFEPTLPVTIADYMAAAISRRPLFWRRKQQIRDQVSQLLEQVGLADRQQLKLGQLSGGEQQRLLFALALQQQTPLWFLDEPMTGLDTDAQQAIEQLLLDQRAQGSTLIMVHHDLEFVRRHADNVLMIAGGLTSSGTPAAVLPSSDSFIAVNGAA